ncbi:hypothetical protein FQZ97_1006650 [compost metagenome]
MGSAITSAATAGGGTLMEMLGDAFGMGTDLLGELLNGVFSSIGNLFSGGAAGGAGGMMSVAGLFGFSDGGQVRGAGTPTSDSIPALLSDQEFITRAAVVQQPGALEFLHQFNRHGMAALASRAVPVRHATGGLAGVPAPALPAPALAGTKLAEPGARGTGNPQLNARIVLVDDRQRIPEAMMSSDGEKAFLTMVERNVPTIRQQLGMAT